MEDQMQQLIGLLVREAGKTFSNAIAEVREAVDFLHYYAGQVRDDFDNETHRPLGPVVCISPWNFPLAIFTGQIAAALAAGNSVLAKPAEQTSLIAAGALPFAGSGRTAGRRATVAGTGRNRRRPAYRRCACTRRDVYRLHGGRDVVAAQHRHAS